MACHRNGPLESNGDPPIYPDRTTAHLARPGIHADARVGRLPQRRTEGRVRLVVRDETSGVGPLDDEDDRGLLPSPRRCDQLPQVPLRFPLH